MFARSVSLHLKPDSVGEFSRVIEKEIIPLLRKQTGFQDEIMFIASGGLEAVGISLWDEKENAEAYDHKTHPELMKALAKFVEGIPQVQTYEVSNSTFHKIVFPDREGN
jgi:hypothetical protein